MAHIKHTEDGTPYISNDWHVEDVESVCEQMEVTLDRRRNGGRVAQCGETALI